MDCSGIHKTFLCTISSRSYSTDRQLNYLYHIPTAVSLTELTHSHAKHTRIHASIHSHTHIGPPLMSLGLGVKHFHLVHWHGSLSVCNRRCQMSEASGCTASFSCKGATTIQSSQQTTQWPPKPPLRSHFDAGLKQNDTFQF